MKYIRFLCEMEIFIPGAKECGHVRMPAAIATAVGKFPERVGLFVAGDYFYRNGNIPLAGYLFRKAAALRNPDAMFALGVVLTHGIYDGGPHLKYDDPVDWWLEAVHYGHALSISFLMRRSTACFHLDHDIQCLFPTVLLHLIGLYMGGTYAQRICACCVQARSVEIRLKRVLRCPMTVLKRSDRSAHLLTVQRRAPAQ